MWKKPFSRRELLRALGACGVGTAALLAGCQLKTAGNTGRVGKKTLVNQDNAGTMPAQVPAQSIRFGFPGWAQQYAEICIAQFQLTEPNVAVEPEPIAGDMIQKLYTMAAGGTTPEAEWIADAHVLPLASQGIMMDMTPMAEASEVDITKEIYPLMHDLGRFESGWYMIAWAADAPVLYYNKSLLDRAGVEAPDPGGMTVADFQMACGEVTSQDEQIYGWHGNEDWWAVYVPWMEGYGGSFYKPDKRGVEINSAECVQACQALADIYGKYNGAVPKGSDLGGDPFILGKAAFTILNRNHCANLRKADVAFEWDVALPPIQPKKHVAGTGTMGPGVTAVAKRDGKEMVAYRLASTVATPATQEYFCSQYLTIPVLMSMAKDPSWYELPPPPANRDVFLEIPKIGITPPTPVNNDCGTVYIGETNKAMSEAWDEMVIGQVPAQEALDKAAKIINECIARGGA